MAIGTSNIKFSDLKTKYNSNGGSIGSSISLSNFRGASFSNGTTVPSSGAISINSHFKGKTFGSSGATISTYGSPSAFITPTGNGTASSPYHTYSTNKSHPSWGYMKFQISGSGKVHIRMEVGSERNYDFGYVFVNGVQKVKAAGYSNGSYYKWPSSSWVFEEYDVTNGMIIEFKYYKDYSVSSQPDVAKFWVYAS